MKPKEIDLKNSIERLVIYAKEYKNEIYIFIFIFSFPALPRKQLSGRKKNGKHREYAEEYAEVNGKIVESDKWNKSYQKLPFLSHFTQAMNGVFLRLCLYRDVEYQRSFTT